MKKNYILRTLLLVVALCGLTTSWGQSYKKITTLDELESGKSYVITGDGASAALNSTIGGGTTLYFTQTDVTIANDVIETSEAAIVWTITKEADGNYSLKCGDVYAGYSGSGNSARAESEYATTCAWSISVADGVFTLKNVAVTTEDRLFQHNKNNSRFATYKPTSNQKNLNLYKEYEAVGVPADLKFEDAGSKTKFYSEGATFDSKATTASTATIAYSSSDEAVATINSEGLVTLKGVGVTTIKAEVEAKGNYQAAVVAYTLTVKGLTDELPYTNDFKSSIGNWINYTVVGTTEWKSSNYGAQINAYQKGATEAYFVSPAFDAKSVALSFGTQLAYSEIPLQLYYSTNFDPQTMSAPSEATWTEITDQATWATSSETTESGEITLNNLTAPVRFAFKYTSTDTDAGRWTVTDLKVEARTSTEATYTVTIPQNDNATIVVTDAEGNVITSGDQVAEGTVLTIEATAKEGYEVEEIWVNAEAIEGNTVTVNGNITISAYVINLYRVNVTIVGEGTVVIKDRDSETTYESGAYIPSEVFVNLVITPATGYEFTSLTAGTNDYTSAVEEGIFQIGTLTSKNWDLTVTFTEVATGPHYCTYSGTNQHSGRSFNSLTVTGGKEDFTIAKYVGKGGDIYQDCTDHVLTADAGAALNFSTSWNGEWMHGYLYIDYNNDEEFDATINEDGTPAEDSEIVSYTFYSPTDGASGKNSAGETVANNSKLDYFPGFTLPANLATGEYRVRFKIDWNELDPCGYHADGKNSLNDNGGLMLDFTLKVEGGNVTPTTYTVNVDAPETLYYELSYYASEDAEEPTYFDSGAQVPAGSEVWIVLAETSDDQEVTITWNDQPAARYTESFVYHTYTFVVNEEGTLKIEVKEQGGNEGYNGKGVFKKVTATTDITSGEYVFVANGYIMSNTVSSNKMSAVEVGTKLSTDGLTVTDPEVAHVWSITEENGIYTIKNGENILGYNTKTDFTFNAEPNATTPDKDQWMLDVTQETPLFHNVNTPARYILLNIGTNNRFGPYAQTNIGAANYYNPVLYKWEKGAVAIEEVEQVESLKVINGKGQLTILADDATHVVIYSITGAAMVNTTIEAGNTTFALPAGIYIVNGAKAIVF